jgi:radical SAM superfamily enzyme YgiQ (UPF0313 family)
VRVSIAYPPLPSDKGVPLLSQNRQFQWFTEPTYIYPMVPAYAATLLKGAGHEVTWDDGIASEQTYEEWMRQLVAEGPDLILIETKTPVIKRHWRIIEELKGELPGVRVALAGDHVTALPLESFQNSPVDYVLTGGDYDFLLLNLADYLEGRARELEPGIYYRDGSGEVRSTGRFSLDHDLNSLPFVDRDLTKWWLYAYKNGNFKYRPGTYTMAGRDCWWRRDGGCTFCAWTVLYPKFRVRRPELLVDEVEFLVERYGVREVFDDTGTFPAGGWLRRFANLMIERGLNERLRFGCNMRFGVLKREDYELLRRAGCRFILFGYESSNDHTLSRLNKGITMAQQLEEVRMAARAGLEPHLTIMFGYPWETREDVMRSMAAAAEMIKRGYVKTWQVTIVIPYPGTKLFEEAKRNGWLLTEDWDEYDMKRPVMRTPLSEEDVVEVTRKMYEVAFSPQYIIRRLLSIRDLDELKYVLWGARKMLGHVRDFSPGGVRRARGKGSGGDGGRPRPLGGRRGDDGPARGGGGPPPGIGDSTDEELGAHDREVPLVGQGAELPEDRADSGRRGQHRWHPGDSCEVRGPRGRTQQREVRGAEPRRQDQLRRLPPIPRLGHDPLPAGDRGVRGGRRGGI